MGIAIAGEAWAASRRLYWPPLGCLAVIINFVMMNDLPHTSQLDENNFIANGACWATGTSVREAMLLVKQLWYMPEGQRL